MTMLKERLRGAVDGMMGLTLNHEECVSLAATLAPDRCEFRVQITSASRERRCVLDRGHAGACKVP